MVCIVSSSDLTKKFGNFTAVNGVTFHVNPGECFGLLGPNGAGKSSIAKMIYGFSPVTSGKLEIFGKDIMTQARTIKGKIGVVAQEDNFLPWLTPLYHAAEAIRALVLGNVNSATIGHLLWLLAITLITLKLPLIMVKNKLMQ